ncbi:MAG: hypothetical protein A2275_14515 [Bacteroidetes bacterium RIFOXYA12_FULL_35_11]|nr:MAG: hypothetical protein A2X01_08690 [Bacteroidetes bacterium GWF2_35_48]OFY74737.1 MAG: hypothetical protein A2275_14515 [Bacteroidetes bacterium RIFOXYA12_FULL_35_11]OFY98925.1 MAG: hypothetical protein A2491_01985 [Bacteroidetes bacterium RIFOXYC12_FULL_35_7]HBX52486.1 hypothetical protein [Bacteroidales bacterium]
MKELTRAEEEIMQILWKIEKGFVKDIVDKIPEPKPAYNTVSTIVRILEKKGFVDHKAYGKTHEYFPLVAKEKYTKDFMKGVVKNYFSNSFRQMVSFFTTEKKLSLKELEEVKAMMEEKIKKTKKIKNK